MYFVDREKIETLLVFLDKQIELLQLKDEWKTPIEVAALERITHLIIEAVLDVGNSMIDGFIMRDPGSYEDIVEILVDEAVVPSEMGESLKTLISYRKSIVQNYTEINHDDIIQAYTIHLQSLKNFSNYIREYIKTQLGPVSAFKN